MSNRTSNPPCKHGLDEELRASGCRLCLLEALEGMCAEFRGYDLPYGSKAYCRAMEVLRAARAAHETSAGRCPLFADNGGGQYFRCKKDASHSGPCDFQ